jgi:hypothetical protein
MMNDFSFVHAYKILHCLVYRPHFVLLLRTWWVKVPFIVPFIPAKMTVTKPEAKRATGHQGGFINLPPSRLIFIKMNKCKNTAKI